MAYRNDRDSLQDQVHHLEEDLAEARREAAEHDPDVVAKRAAELEAQVGALRSQLGAVERELEKMRPKRRPVPQSVVAAGIAFALTSLGAGVWLLTRSRTPPSSEAQSMQTPPAPPTVATSPPAPDPTEQMRRQDAEPAPTSAPVEPAKPPPIEPSRTTTARWIAHVKRAQGIPIGAGSACNIDATLVTHSTNASVSEFVVTCGKQKLYAKSDPLNGMAMIDYDPREQLGPNDEKSRFAIQYSDKGTRSATRNQVEIDSSKGTGLVFSDNLPAFRLELVMPIESELASPLNGAAQRLARTGHVETVSGKAPVKADAPCTVRALPTGQHSACVVEVRCGGKALVTPANEVECEYEGTRVVTFKSKGPLSARLVYESVRIADEGPKPYEVHIALDPAAAQKPE